MDMKCAKYTAIYAKTNTGYSAHIPDLPGCIATGGGGSVWRLV